MITELLTITSSVKILRAYGGFLGTQADEGRGQLR